MSCDTETLTALIESISCSKPAYCPPCVSTVSAVVDSNTTRIQALEDGIGSQVLTGSAVLDFGSLATLSTLELTITVTGATVGDAVALGPPSTIDAELQWSGYVSAANTVTVRLYNPTAGAIDPASATWKAAVIVVA